MGNKKLLRYAGYAALVVLAIGGIGYAVNQGGSGSDADESGALGLSATEEGFGDDSLRSSANSVAGSIGVPTDGGKALADRDGESAAQAPSGGAVAPPQTGPGPGGALTAAIDRKIVQTASMQLQVDEVGASFEEVGRIATASGGFVASSSVSYHDDKQVASVTIRVPAESYQTVLASLRELGVKVDAEKSDASDVTEEYTDLTSRLRNLEATDAQLLALLARAESITDILTVQDRLNQVRSEIEQIKGRMQLLEDLTDLATITVHLRPVVAGTGGDNGGGTDLGAEVSEAWDNSMEFLGDVAAGVITVVVFAWWVPLVAAPALIAYRAMTRNRANIREAAD